MINCPYCGKLTDPKLDNCPHCGGYMRRSAGAPAPGAGQRQTCPNCHALVQDGDILCVNCGTNLLTGQKITEEKRVVARQRQSRRWLMTVIAVVAVLAAILLVVWLMVVGRDPVARAEELINKDRKLEAAEVLTKYVETNPSNAAAQFQLGKLNWINKDFRGAASAFEAAATLDYSDTVAVTIDGVNIGAAFTHTGDTITATVPAAATLGLAAPSKAVDVAVQITRGANAPVTATSTGGLTYVGPRVVSVAPNNGSAAGGDAITVNGEGFTSDNLTATLGGVALTNIANRTATSFTATTGTHPIGSVGISVVNSNLFTGTTAGVFTYTAIAPVLVDVIHDVNPPEGGYQIDLYGQNFVTPD